MVKTQLEITLNYREQFSKFKNLVSKSFVMLLKIIKILIVRIELEIYNFKLWRTTSKACTVFT